MTQNQASKLPSVELWTDGSVMGNPGKGGWAAILRMGTRCRVLGGYVPMATNNYMEALGALEGLRALNQPCNVSLYTDSRYVINGVARLQRRSRLKTNVEIWDQMAPHVARHSIQLIQVAGHSGYTYNEYADTVASSAREWEAKIDYYTETVPEAVQKRSDRRKGKQAARTQRLP